MEQIIPILVAVAFFVYQAYSNYQKEQEKARKRNPGQRPPQQEVEEYQADEPMSFPDDSWYEPAPQPQHQTYTPTPQEEAIPSKYEKYAGVVDTDEVRALRQRGVQRQKYTIQPVELVEVGEAAGSDDEIDFDLRNAVIQSAILERPYQ